MNSVNQESTPTQEHYHYTLYSLLFCQGYAQRIATHRQPRSTCQHSFRGKELKLPPGALTSQQLPGNPDQTLHVKPQKLMQFVLYIFVFHMYTHTCVYIICHKMHFHIYNRKTCICWSKHNNSGIMLLVLGVGSKKVLGKYRGWEYGDEAAQDSKRWTQGKRRRIIGLWLDPTNYTLVRTSAPKSGEAEFSYHFNFLSKVFLQSMGGPIQVQRNSLRHEPVNADMWKLRWRWNSKSRLLKGIDCGGFDGFALWFFPIMK